MPYQCIFETELYFYLFQATLALLSSYGRNILKNILVLFSSKLCGSPKPVYQAIWAENTDFDEVLISPTMVNDHMPDNVLDALEKVSFISKSIVLFILC